MKRTRVVVSGRVQGVFFRDSCARLARQKGVGGWVRNDRSGTVEAVFEGEDAAVEAMVAWCATGPSEAVVASVDQFPEAPVGEEGFRVR